MVQSVSGKREKKEGTQQTSQKGSRANCIFIGQVTCLEPIRAVRLYQNQTPVDKYIEQSGKGLGRPIFGVFFGQEDPPYTSGVDQRS
jgi:hypothetical protein